MADFDNRKGIDTSSFDGTDAMISEAYKFLDNGQWKSAEVFCDGILAKDPDNVKMCLCKLLAKNHCKSKEALKELEEPFDDDPLYKKIVELGSIELKGELEVALLFIKARMAEKADAQEQKKKKVREKAELEAKAKIYEFAAKNQDLDTIKSLKLAESKFMSISGWSDADERAEVCRNRIKELAEKAKAEKAEKKANKKKFAFSLKIIGSKIKEIIDNAKSKNSAKKTKNKTSKPKIIGIAAGSVTALLVIGFLIFYIATGSKMFKVENGALKLNKYYIGNLPSEIIIPEEIDGKKVTSIGYRTFSGCINLTNITIPEGVTNIGDGAFYGCTGLTSITIPESVTSIGYNAFYNCTELTSITIPKSVTSIGYNAFYNCTGLTNIEIPNSVTSIGDGAFSGCTSLNAVHISSLESWLSIRFDSFDANPLFCAKNLYLNGDLVTEVTVPDTIKSINAYAFSGCQSLASITIPKSVTSIGDLSFYFCFGLTSITIPESVTSIGYAAFHGCIGLTSITIPESVTSIGKYTFFDCRSLTSITIPEGVTNIGDDAFYNCKSLNAVHISSIESWLNIKFEGESSNPLLWAKNLYLNGDLVTEVTVPDTVKSINDYAFYGCTGLTSITIPDSVISIGYLAFDNCTGLESIIFEDTSTWYYRNYWNNTGGRKIDVTDATKNVKYFTDTYKTNYWYKE